MTEIHNAELTQEMITGAVAAWLEQINDSAMIIDVGFHRDGAYESNFDLIAETTINILKASDFRPMKRGDHEWTREDQTNLMNIRKGRRIKNIQRVPKRPPPGYMLRIRRMLNKLKFVPRQPKPMKQAPVPKSKPVEVKKYVARKWELPSAEYYPVRYVDGVRRQLTNRKSAQELATAQEAPAIREKGEAQDRTDQDCRSIPADLTSSKESVLSEASTQKTEKSVVEEPKPKEEPAPKEEKQEEVKKEEPPKIVEEVKKEPEPEPKKVEEVPKVEEKKEEVVEKKEEVVVPTKKKSKRNVKIRLTRRPDSGELTILSEENGMVTFSCSTKHRAKKTSKKSEKSEVTEKSEMTEKSDKTEKSEK